MRVYLVLAVLALNVWALADILSRPGRGTIRSVLLVVFVPVIGVALHIRRRRAARPA